MFKSLIAKLRSNRGETATGPDVTKESGAKESSQSDEKLEGVIQDIDFTDVPEDIREAVKAKVSAKVKNYDSGYRAKSEDLSIQRKELEAKADSLKELEKLKEEIQGNPEFEKVVNKAITDFRAGKTSTPKQTEKNLSKIENLINNADSAEERERLVLMRDIIHEEAKGNDSSEEINSLKEKIKNLEAASNVGLSASVNSAMDKLEAKFGKETVSKYPGIKDLLMKYPSYIDSPDKVFYQVVPSEEAEKALAEHISNKQKLENKQKEEGVFPGSPSTPKKTDFKRDSRGRVDVKSTIDTMISDGKFRF